MLPTPSSQQPNEKSSIIKRILITAVVLVFVLWVAASLKEVFSRFSPKKSPSAPIINVEKPSSDDHSSETLLGFLASVDPAESATFYQKCGSSGSWNVLSPACEELLAKHEPLLAKFDKWASSTGLSSLTQPANLGNRIRIPFPYGSKPEEQKQIQGNVMKAEVLYALYMYRGLRAYFENRIADGIHHLEVLSALAGFFQQNPSGIQFHLAGLSLQEHWIEQVAEQLGAEHLTVQVLTFFPTPEQMLASLQFALESEMQMQRDVKAGELENWASRHYAFLSDFLFKKKEYMEYLEDWRGWHDSVVKSGKLGTHFIKPYQASWTGTNFWNRFDNGTGRSSAKRWIQYWERENTAQTSDMLQATRIVVAARLFKAKSGRWPATEGDLVPAYLQQWPKSLLDGQPIRWQEKRQGVFIFDKDGVSQCKGSALCNFPFEPPMPLFKK